MSVTITRQNSAKVYETNPHGLLLKTARSPPISREQYQSRRKKEDINHYYQIADILDTYDFAWSGFDVILHHYVAKSNDFTNVPAYTVRTDLAVTLIQNALPGWKWRCFPFSGEELIKTHTVEKPVKSMVVAWYTTKKFDSDHCDFTNVHIDLETTWAVMLLKSMLQLMDRLSYNT